MDNKKMVIVTLGGGYYADQKGGQALIFTACLPGSPKGGLRHRLTIGGDSYGC